jgi:hypothetical protein
MSVSLGYGALNSTLQILKNTEDALRRSEERTAPCWMLSRI